MYQISPNFENTCGMFDRADNDQAYRPIGLLYVKSKELHLKQSVHPDEDDHAHLISSAVHLRAPSVSPIECLTFPLQFFTKIDLERPVTTTLIIKLLNSYC